jgi:hypothetical protein
MSAPERSSAFFFVGRFEPAELANFNVQNIELEGDGVLEVLGRGVGVWWRSRPRSSFDELGNETRDWLQTICASYFLLTRTALEVRLTNWNEALDAHVAEAVVGFIDSRFRVIRTAAEGEQVNAPLRRAVELARALRGRLHLQRGVLELWRSRLDPSDEAFLSAFRALECVRRRFESTGGRRKASSWALPKVCKIGRFLHG